MRIVQISIHVNIRYNVLCYQRGATNQPRFHSSRYYPESSSIGRDDWRIAISKLILILLKEFFFRQISRSWNAIVVEDLNKTSLPLERVYFCSKAGGFDRNTLYSDSRNEAAMKEVHMYAKFAKRYSSKVGVRKWLAIYGASKHARF